MAIAGELAALIERIQGRAYKVTSLALIRNETGQPLSYHAYVAGNCRVALGNQACAFFAVEPLEESAAASRQTQTQG